MNQLIPHLQAQISRLSEQIASGCCIDFMDYCKLTGEIRGYRKAIDIARELASQSNDNE